VAEISPDDSRRLQCNSWISEGGTVRIDESVASFGGLDWSEYSGRFGGAIK
jgi:hypothetical protein